MSANISGASIHPSSRTNPVVSLPSPELHLLIEKGNKKELESRLTPSYSKTPGNATKAIDLNQPMSNGELPLANAVRLKQYDLIPLFIKSGADPVRKDSQGLCAVEYAAINNDNEMYTALLTACVQKNTHDYIIQSTFSDDDLQKMIKTNESSEVHFKSLYDQGKNKNPLNINYKHGLMLLTTVMYWGLQFAAFSNPKIQDAPRFKTASDLTWLFSSLSTAAIAMTESSYNAAVRALIQSFVCRFDDLGTFGNAASMLFQGTNTYYVVKDSINVLTSCWRNAAYNKGKALAKGALQVIHAADNVGRFSQVTRSFFSALPSALQGVTKSVTCLVKGQDAPICQEATKNYVCGPLNEYAQDPSCIEQTTKLVCNTKGESSKACTQQKEQLAIANRIVELKANLSRRIPGYKALYDSEQAELDCLTDKRCKTLKMAKEYSDQVYVFERNCVSEGNTQNLFSENQCSKQNLKVACFFGKTKQACLEPLARFIKDAEDSCKGDRFGERSCLYSKKAFVCEEFGVKSDACTILTKLDGEASKNIGGSSQRFQKLQKEIQAADNYDYLDKLDHSQHCKRGSCVESEEALEDAALIMDRNFSWKKFRDTKKGQGYIQRLKRKSNKIFHPNAPKSSSNQATKAISPEKKSEINTKVNTAFDLLKKYHSKYIKK